MKDRLIRKSVQKNAFIFKQNSLPESCIDWVKLPNPDKYRDKLSVSIFGILLCLILLSVIPNYKNIRKNERNWIDGEILIKRIENFHNILKQS